MKVRERKPSKTVKKESIAREQFKCRSCQKRQNCYGSRYCQNEFKPVSLVTLLLKKKK
jgi:uncharacterized protein CbrC (UPF0167 family)